MRSIRLFISIIRNIYERDWHTPYSKRPKKWRCGWGMKYAKGGVLPGRVDYEPENGERVIPLKQMRRVLGLMEIEKRHKESEDEW